MNNKFDEFKNKSKIETIIKTIILSLSINLVFEGIVILLCKTIPLHHNALIEIILNLIAFALTFMLLYKKFVISDKEIAKRLDKQDNLKEKVQTMVEFKDDDSLMALIQKEDACEKIENVSTKGFKLKISFKNFASLLVAILLLTSTFFVNQKDFPINASDNNSSTSEEENSSSSSEEENESESSSEGNETSGENSTENGQNGDKEDIINDLIDKVDNADIDESLKDEIKKDLEDLKNDLNNNQNNQEKQDQDIDDTKDDINQDVDKSNSASQIGDSLQKEDSTKDLGEQISNKDSNGTSSSLDQMREDFKNALNDAKNNGVSEDDSLYKALDEFADDLKNLEDKVNDSDVQDKISDAFDNLKDKLSDSLNKQNNASSIKDEIDKALDDMKNNQSSSSGDDNKNDENDDNNNQGGAGGDGAGTGKGDIVYAADDKIYDPTTNSYVTYGELMDYYNKLVLEGLVDGNYSDDLQALISAYFSSLYNDEDKN